MFLVLQDEVQILLKSIIEMAYFMRGSMTYDSILLTMTYAERQLVSSFLKSRLEQERESLHPVY